MARPPWHQIKVNSKGPEKCENLCHKAPSRVATVFHGKQRFPCYPRGTLSLQTSAWIFLNDLRAETVHALHLLHLAAARFHLCFSRGKQAKPFSPPHITTTSFLNGVSKGPAHLGLSSGVENYYLAEGGGATLVKKPACLTGMYYPWRSLQWVAVFAVVQADATCIACPGVGSIPAASTCLRSLFLDISLAIFLSLFP